MEKRLDGKAAIVTGAGQTSGDAVGNGRAIATLFARAGARVMLADINLDSALETKAAIDKEGGESFAFHADVGRADDCRRMADKCVETYGRIDILVNNVGIAGVDNGPVWLQEDVWDRTLNVNLKSMFLTCKYVLPYMEQQGGGAIVNVSSAASVCSVPLLAYKTSKAGVNALTQEIAMEYAGRGIRVNAVMLGLIHTPMAIDGWCQIMNVSKEDMIAVRNSLVPLKGGMGSAWDTAHAVLFLASDEAKFITGVVLPVDGGQCAKIGL